MSIRAGEVRLPGADNFTFSFDELVRAAQAQGLAPAAPKSARARRRMARTGGQVSGGVLAAALGLEGCKTVGGGGDGFTPVTPGPADPSAPPPPVDASVYAVPEAGMSQISAADLLASQPGAVALVEVLGSPNGTVSFSGGIVHFTPHDGASGLSGISFTYRDAAGNIRSARFEINIDDEAARHQGHHSHGMDGGHGGHHGSDGHGGHGDLGEHDDHAMVHPDDPGKAAEHMAAMELVPATQATHVAVKNGSWFDPSTWAGGKVPGDGAKVFIPDGVSVKYDGESPASIFTVRVDGSLDFATDRDTFLEVDTLVVTPKGSLTIGTADNPVAANVQSVISIADNGPINVGWDPMLLSRGVISHGEVQIHGAEKTSHLKVAVDPMKGDTSLKLESIPEGWRVGDKIVLGGTHYVEPAPTPTGGLLEPVTEDEELVIVGISGNTVYLDRPLQYDHEGARSDLKASVANYTRNVRFETENADHVPTHQRGHIMFMHSDDVDVRYAEFYELGRTDKTERAFEAAELDHVSSDSNVKGRYSLHIHRAGVGDLDDPAMIVGNAVWGSPGWGYVHHDSNAILADNASYNVSGAAYVAELGNETGRWANNISIKTWGLKLMDKNGDDINAFDVGRNGAGFWFQGRSVDAVDNVAIGATGGGFVYMHRIRPDLYKSVDPHTAQQSDKLGYLDEVYLDKPNIGMFLNNEVIGSYMGLHVVKFNSKQNHDVRSVIENFTAWEVQIGADLEYTAHYTLKNFDVVSTDPSKLRTAASYGIFMGPEIYDLVVIDSNLDGFRFGVFAKRESVNGLVKDDNFEYFFVNVQNTGLDEKWHGIRSHEILSSADLANVELSYYSNLLNKIVSGPAHQSHPDLILDGVKTDALGSVNISKPFDPREVSYDSLRGAVEQNGYWLTNDGRKVTLVEEYIADRTTGDLQKFGFFVELGGRLDPGHSQTDIRTGGQYNGVLDFANVAPVGNTDHYTVKAGQSIVLDVLANDFDPEGGDLDLDGLQLGYGHAVENENNTVTYFADPSQRGTDTFYYWVEDDQGNFTKTAVHITVEI